MDINYPQRAYHPNDSFPCYVVNITTNRGIWQSENPWTQALPLVIIQLSILLSLNQFTFFLLKPLHVPRLASDAIACMPLANTLLHRSKYIKSIFPIRSILISETLGYWALCLHLFLIGLSTDISAVFRVGKRATVFSAVTVCVSFVLGCCLFLLVLPQSRIFDGALFYGAAFAMTGFPCVAKILSDLKIIHSEMGRLATSASLVSDLASWVLLAVILPSQVNFSSTLNTVVLTLLFTSFCYFAVRPALAYLISKTSKEKTFSEAYLNFVLASVSVFACASDAFGTTPMVGAFVYGLIMPSRELASKLIESFEDFINEYLMPLYFAIVGLRMKFPTNHRSLLIVAIAVLSCFIKIIGAFAGAYFTGMPAKEGLALGVVMNGKNIMAFVILVMGYDLSNLIKDNRRVISSDLFTAGVLGMVLMTAAIPFVLRRLHPFSSRLSSHQSRTIQKSRKDAEFRILTCLHNPRHVSAIINLLDSSNPSPRSPLLVSAIHLLELTGRNSSMLIVHSTGKNPAPHSHRHPSTDEIVSAFESYSSAKDGIAVINPMTLLSPYNTMHEDICSLAEDKQVTLIILPFHKSPSPSGQLEDNDDAAQLRAVNLNVLSNAPCTVAIFVDKLFGNVTYHKDIAMIFLGGPDDREALAYASRMAETSTVRVTLIRISPGDDVEEFAPSDMPAGDAQRLLTSASYVDKQRRLDDNCVREFAAKFGESAAVLERRVNNEEEAIGVLRETEGEYDLYVVGKGEGAASRLTAGLMDWCEFPELGAIGDLLVTSSFAQRGSVVVVQQYVAAGDLAHLMAEEEVAFGAVEDDAVMEMEPFTRGSKSNSEVDGMEKGF